MRIFNPRVWLTLGVVVLLGPALALIGLYHLGILLAPSTPRPPTELLKPDEAQRVFAESDWQAELALQPIGLRSVARIAVCETLSPLRDPRRCRARSPGVVAASRAAQLHLAREGTTGWRRELATGSLAVWISRHWSAEQVATYLDASAPRIRTER